MPDWPALLSSGRTSRPSYHSTSPRPRIQLLAQGRQALQNIDLGALVRIGPRGIIDPDGVRFRRGLQLDLAERHAEALTALDIDLARARNRADRDGGVVLGNGMSGLRHVKCLSLRQTRRTVVRNGGDETGETGGPACLHRLPTLVQARSGSWVSSQSSRTSPSDTPAVNRIRPRDDGRVNGGGCVGENENGARRRRSICDIVQGVSRRSSFGDGRQDPGCPTPSQRAAPPREWARARLRTSP